MSPVKARKTTSNVMVVDDNPANLKLMGDMLGLQGYEVRLFPRGRLALASASQRPPDLVLLDVNMPEMDGYQVCQRFKSDPGLSQIPVIFLSALRETQDKVKGLECGGVDYIAKPFQLEEVQARVETHLKIHQLQRSLQHYNQRLEEAVAARTRELMEAHARLKILDQAKNDFLHLISHEFRTPLNGLLGVGDLALDGLPRTDETRELIDMFEASRRRILAILDDAVLLTQIDVAGETLPSGPVRLCRVLDRAVERCAVFARELGVAVDLDPDAAGVEVVGDEDLLVIAIHALAEACLKLTSSGQTMRWRHEAAAGGVRVVIEGEGKTVPPQLIEKFFDLFAMNEAGIVEVNLGLRPAVACRILTLFGGSASVSNRDSRGIRLTAFLKTPPVHADL
jgi:two-component system sensor histidine kinase/response regulator